MAVVVTDFLFDGSSAVLCVFGGTLFVDNCIGACFVFVVGGASDNGDTMLREVDAVVAEVRVLLLLLRLLLLPLFLL